MAVSDEIFLLTALLGINYWFFYKTHPFVASIFTILLGASTFMFATTNNVMGTLVIMMGIITLLNSPWDEKNIVRGRFS